MNPDSTRTPTGTLQWPLPIAGTITSQFGHRVDPITGEVRPCISIFMNVVNVHVNRMPVAGKIEAIRYFPGAFFNAALDKASTDNERCAIWCAMRKIVRGSWCRWPGSSHGASSAAWRKGTPLPAASATA